MYLKVKGQIKESNSEGERDPVVNAYSPYVNWFSLHVGECFIGLAVKLTVGNFHNSMT